MNNSTTDEIPKDTPITRVSIDKMTDEQIDALLISIRERRLHLLRVYEEAQELKRSNELSKAVDKLNQQCKMFEKELSRVDAALDKLEKRTYNIKALRLEIED